MNNLILQSPFAPAYRGRRVFVTGHSGFKGSWLSRWLTMMGANVTGYSLPPETDPNHLSLIDPTGIDSHFGDLAETERLNRVMRECQPEIVFHLAAQPLVRRSYRQPEWTFNTNVGGTVAVLEACRNVASVRAVVVVTSDKVYQNRESERGYREEDALGGYDPYSCSKACCEFAVATYRNCFFSSDDSAFVASVRAGNVIGGGDWSEDRLIPDAVRAISHEKTLHIRNPNAVRPWQHVLEPLGGYLMLGQRLLNGGGDCARAWNFGPDEPSHVPVGRVIEQFAAEWPALMYKCGSVEENAPKETSLLKIDSSAARSQLGWTPVWNSDQTLKVTARWYRDFITENSVRTDADIYEYVEAYLQSDGVRRSPANGL